MKESNREKFPVSPGTRDLEQFAAELEIEGGAHLDRLPVGHAIEVETQNTIYTIEHRRDGFYISGNSKYCPEPVKIEYIGSTLGGSAIKMNFVGRESILEIGFRGRDPIKTSWVRNVKEVKLPPRETE